jgi:TPR repeat protein
MMSLGEMYLGGEGVEQDTAKGVEWIIRAAESRSSDAMYALGGMYLRGDCIEENRELGIKWTKAAADAGNMLAKMALERLNN